jgi:hypothetical protein
MNFIEGDLNRMRNVSRRWYLVAIMVLVLALSGLALTSCAQGQTGALAYDAGANDLSVTASQMTQYYFFRFDTSATARTFSLPGAVDIVSSFSPAAANNFFIFGVTADGANEVNILGGANTTVKASVKTVAGNTTATIFCVFNNISSGSQAVSIY